MAVTLNTLTDTKAMLAPFSFSSFASQSNIFHGSFNRHGGVSPPPFASLNVSFGVADMDDNVRANRGRIKKTCQADILVSGQQVHGTEVLVIGERPARDKEFAGYDAFITNVPGVGLMVQQADCQAVLLYDPCRNVVANIHCGWRGSVANIIGTTIITMEKSFSTKATDLLAAISPSLGPCCAEFIHFREELPTYFHTYQVKPHFFDFRAISKDQLCQAGLKPNNIWTSSICTVCNPDWFSYRRKRETGRFCSIIGIKK